jgi:hypothetical protein
MAHRRVNKRFCIQRLLDTIEEKKNKTIVKKSVLVNTKKEKAKKVKIKKVKVKKEPKNFVEISELCKINKVYKTWSWNKIKRYPKGYYSIYTDASLRFSLTEPNVAAYAYIIVRDGSEIIDINISPRFYKNTEKSIQIFEMRAVCNAAGLCIYNTNLNNKYFNNTNVTIYTDCKHLLNKRFNYKKIEGFCKSAKIVDGKIYINALGEDKSVKVQFVHRENKFIKIVDKIVNKRTYYKSDIDFYNWFNNYKLQILNLNNIQ